jgi:protease-4
MNRSFFTGLFSGCGLSIFGCIALGVCVFIGAGASAASSTSGGGVTHVSGPNTGPAIAIIDVSGAIVSGRPDPFDTSGVAASGVLVPLIQQAARNPDVKVLLLRVDSPGGGVVASDEIYHALKKANKPIVVLMGDTAASGGYYISMAAQYIIANPNTLTGSIGVIAEFPEASELFEKIGVRFQVVKSGAVKDIGGPWRPLTDDEKALMQKIIDETYSNFVALVAQGRQLPEAQVRPIADGRVFTGKQALELKLIDAVGYEEDAIAKAASLGGLSGEPRVIRYHRSTGFASLLNEQDWTRLFAARSWSPRDLREWLAPTLEYRWAK